MSTPDPLATGKDSARDEWQGFADELAAGVPADRPPLSDAAVSREGLYAEAEEGAVTIEEAAARLGVNPRRLRRILERGEYAARTVTVTRRTVTGTRPAAALPPDLLADVAALLADAATRESVPGTQPGPAGSPQANAAQTLTPDGDTNPANAAGTVQESGVNIDNAANADTAAFASPFGPAVSAALLAAVEAERDRARADLEAERAARAADVERWSRAHDQAQQLQLAALAEVAEWRRRAAELESTNARLVAALPAPGAEKSANYSAPNNGDVRTDKSAKAPHEAGGGEDTPRSAGDASGRITPARAAGDTLTGDGDRARVSAPPGASPVKKPGFFARLFGGGRERGEA